MISILVILQIGLVLASKWTFLYSKLLFMFCRQFASAFDDLREAVKLAPTNRELQRLLMRVKDECQEQAALEGHGGASKRPEETEL